MVSIKDQIYISSLTREVYDIEIDRVENREQASSSSASSVVSLISSSSSDRNTGGGAFCPR